MSNTFDTCKDLFPEEVYDFGKGTGNYQYFAKTNIWFKPEVATTGFVQSRFKFHPDDPDLGEWVVNKPKELAEQITLRLVWEWDSETDSGYWSIEIAGPIAYMDLTRLLEPIEEYKEFIN